MTSSHFLDSDNHPAVGDAQKRRSAILMADSKSSYNISPHHGVLGMMDLKLILEFRRTMTHQQRIFAAQIFELHRLIKVQRSISRSPELFASEHKQYFRKQPPKGCSNPENKSQINTEPLSSQVKVHFDPQTPKLNTERRRGNACFKLLHPLKHDYLQGHHSTRFLPEPSEPLQSTSDSKPRPCAMNQWLVPVTSSSEGLVYKPYIGPCPPPTGSLAPIYFTPSSVDGVFVNMICSVPASSHLDNGICTSCYTLPVASTLNPSSSAEQSNPFATNWRCGPTQFPSPHGNNCVGIPDQSSCSVISQNNQSSNSNNTISSSCEKMQSVLSLFPTTPNIQASNQPVLSRVDEQQPRQVIKAVPHNPKLASESTARILKCIQDERKCC